MTLTVDPPPVETPDAGVIEEARARQLRHRGLLAAALLAIGAIVLASVGGGGGSHRMSAVPRRQRPPAKTARLSRSSCPSGKGKALQSAPSHSLLSILGVLRRAPTTADKLPTSIRHNIIGTGFVSDVFVRYIRRTRVVGGSPHYVYPAILSGCAGNQPHVGMMDIATNVDLGHGIIGGDGGGGGGEQIERAEDAGTGPPGSATSATITMLVPDGVAEVTLRYPAGRASGYSPRISPPVTIETRPVENQVVVRVPRSGGGGTIRKVKMIWRAADGHVIRTFDRL